MNRAPKVSVLVPAYNDGKYLDQALASVAAQTFRDVEAIIADDASTDDTPEIARAWTARDPRFRLSRLEINVGMNRNWNRALAEARGDLVIKLDGDDVMTPACLALLRTELEADARLGLAACRTLDCDEDLRPVAPFPGDKALRLHGVDPEARHVRTGLDWLRLCFDDAQLWHSDAQMYRRDELVALGGWDEQWFSSDTELILRALATNRPVVHRPEVGIHYRRRPGSASQRERSSGALAFAGSMILLRALHANRDRLAPLSRELRQNWWRIWRLFQGQRLSLLSPAQSLPGELAARLAEQAHHTAQLVPPWAVRLEGSLREAAWRSRQRWAAGLVSRGTRR